MSMPDAELLKRFHHLALLARQAGGPTLIDRRRKTSPGGVTEATETTALRDYAPGDDYLQVDWNWCARHDELLTKTFRGDEDLHLYVLLDCSPSMEVGSPSKFRLAKRIAAGLGYLAAAHLYRMTPTAFADGILCDGPPIRHKARLAVLLRFLRQLRLQGTRTDLARTAESFAGRRQRPGPVVVLSDLYDSNGFQAGFDILRGHGYQPCLVHISDPSEANPAVLGDVELVDMETGVARPATVTERASAHYVQIYAEFCESVRDFCRRRGIACMQITTDTPEDRVLLELFGGKAVGTQ